ITPVDATGAGDQFAAGLIFGLASGVDLETAGRMGVMAASEVISHVGARPERDLRADFEAAGLI
ncbi:MAG: PfkB family carbohydrate kinase, partial [Paracoccus sp. (in: a-proteobacteria)]|nr:PfkB family carbohydrate kinase [Paracoccus sp. (in: a-proteobacteria)]